MAPRGENAGAGAGAVQSLVDASHDGYFSCLMVIEQGFSPDSCQAATHGDLI